MPCESDNFARNPVRSLVLPSNSEWIGHVSQKKLGCKMLCRIAYLFGYETINLSLNPILVINLALLSILLFGPEIFSGSASAMYLSRKCFATDWHRSRFGAQVARIERQLQRSPQNVEVRSRLVLAYSKELARCNRTALWKGTSAHTCSDFLELAHLHGMEFLKASTEATDRIQSVMNTLLDLKDLQLYPLIARFAVTLARHEECLSEFDWKGELQERASMFHYETALQLLKSVNRTEEAQEVFDEAVSLERGGRRMIAWTKLYQTPSVYVRGLRPVSAWWEARDLPLAEVLEENMSAIRSELQNLLEKGGQMVVDPAYPRLTSLGDWDVIRLYFNKRWDPAAVALAPKTTELLRDKLPGASKGLPYIHYNTEEVCFFRMTPGTRVMMHSGGCNARLNLSLGLLGCSDSFIQVAGDERRWRNGELLAFDDSCDHSARHDGEEDRWVLTVGVMHPDLVERPEIFDVAVWRSEYEAFGPEGLATFEAMGSAASVEHQRWRMETATTAEVSEIVQALPEDQQLLLLKALHLLEEETAEETRQGNFCPLEGQYGNHETDDFQWPALPEKLKAGDADGGLSTPPSQARPETWEVLEEPPRPEGPGGLQLFFATLVGSHMLGHHHSGEGSSDDE
eukprot:s620_g1.t1